MSTFFFILLAIVSLTWMATVFVAFHAAACGATPKLPKHSQLRRAWTTILLGHFVTLPLPVTGFFLSMWGVYGSFTSNWPIILILFVLTVAVQIGAFLRARHIRPEAEVTAKHIRLLPAVWGVLVVLSVLIWGAMYLLLGLSLNTYA